MGLSKALQSPDILSTIMGRKYDEVIDIIMAKGSEYYADNPQESEMIRQNLASFGLPSDLETVKLVQEHVIHHYVEKIFPLSGTPQQLATFVDERMDLVQANDLLTNALKEGSVLLVTAHFGAVEYVASALARLKFPVNSVLRFSTQNLSDKIQGYAKILEDSELFSLIKFIEIGKEGSHSAFSMARVLDRKEILYTVFDEETSQSKPVKLFNRNVLGGAGLDRLLKFAHGKVTIFNSFMIREGEKFKLQLLRVDAKAEDIAQQMFNNLQIMLEKHLEQWYFLHEEIPFVD